MRLPGRRHHCGPLLELGWISRLLRLGRPVPEDVETIPVSRIIGTAHRGRDFDGCWHPIGQRLAKTLSEIEDAQPVGIDEPIELVRVDRAYFVVDGHKRVALAKRSGREFLDAQVSHLPTPYQLSPDVEADAILRTAREGEFRRHSGMEQADPAARFALTDADDYGELLEAVQSHAFVMAERDGALPARAAAAEDWYRSDYLPNAERLRAELGDVLRPCTDADLYLLVHRQRLASWGTECDAAECAADQVLLRQRIEARGHGAFAHFLPRAAEGAPAAPLLPLAGDGEPE